MLVFAGIYAFAHLVGGLEEGLFEAHGFCLCAVFMK